MIEFEVKAPVPDTLVAPLRQRLGAPEHVEDHVDVYFRHPARDVTQTDEAIRLSMRGERVELTYKGPRLDPRTKTRREVSVGVEGEGEARAFLEALGFAPAFELRKRRERFHADGFEVALDDVPGLGVFVEVERLLDEGGAREDVEDVEARADALLDAWGLEARERRSYLELMLARRSATAP